MRTFDFEGRPARHQYMAAIRAALDDEGLALATPGQSARITDTITADGKLRVRVPELLISPKRGAHR